MGKFLTPPTIPPDTVLRVVRIPRSVEWLGLVGGALAPLFFYHSWEAFGSVTPQEASETAKSLIMETFYGGSGLIGTIVPYATSEVPPMLLPCDGSLYNGADYPLLFSRLPSVLKVGDDQFVTPNLGGRVIVGAGEGTFGVTPRDPFQLGGAEDVTLTEAQMPSHNHGVNAAISPRDTEPGIAVSVWTESILEGANTNSRGGDEAHNNMQPFYVLSYGIVFA